MPYLGSAPATSFQTLSKQDFTTSATTSYTLSNSVTSANDIALFINNVRQEPTYAYSASGTALTLTAATSSSDDMYCIYLGRAVGTINPASGSVGLAQLSATGTKSSSTFLRGDNSFASISTTPNAPMFLAYLSSDTAFTNNTQSKVQCDTELFDTAGNYDNSTNFRFTPTVAGKYYVFGNISYYAVGQANLQWVLNRIWKNGTSSTSSTHMYAGYTDHRTNLGDAGNSYIGGIFDMNGSSDYIELYSYPSFSSGTPVAAAGTSGSYFGAYKLGV